MLLKTEVITTKTGSIQKVTGVHAGYYKQIQKLPDLEQINALGQKIKADGFREDPDLRREDYDNGVFTKVLVKEA